MSEGDGLFVVDATVDEAPVDVSVQEEARETSGDIEGLIPLCVQHAKGPQMNTATYGYDIAQMEKRPWAEPAAKLSDYFNYGFNEKSWRLYCAMQAQGEASLLASANEMLRKLEKATAGNTERPLHADEGRGDDSHDTPHQPPPLPPVTQQPPYGEPLGYHPPFASRGGFRGPYQGDRGPYASGPPGGHGSYKTKLCQRYSEGRCLRGNECNYAHGISDLRRVPAEPAVSMVQNAPLNQPPPNAGYLQPGQQAYPTPPYHSGPPGAAPLGDADNNNDEGGRGFRVPPKRPRPDDSHEGIYEPQY